MFKGCQYDLRFPGMTGHLDGAEWELQMRVHGGCLGQQLMMLPVVSDMQSWQQLSMRASQEIMGLLSHLL